MKAKLSLTQYILIGLVLGLLVGIISPEVGSSLSILSTIFVRLLQMMVVPLVFSTLVVGVAGAEGGSSLKRLAFRTIVALAQDDPELAATELAAFDASNPPVDMLQLIDGFGIRERIADAGG